MVDSSASQEMPLTSGNTPPLAAVVAGAPRGAAALTFAVGASVTCGRAAIGVLTGAGRCADVYRSAPAAPRMTSRMPPSTSGRMDGRGAFGAGSGSWSPTFDLRMLPPGGDGFTG